MQYSPLNTIPWIPRVDAGTIEPGVYLKGRFGVRSEVNVYLAESEAVVTGQPIQTHVTPILSF